MRNASPLDEYARLCRIAFLPEEERRLRDLAALLARNRHDVDADRARGLPVGCVAVGNADLWMAERIGLEYLAGGEVRVWVLP